jgi:hypothetical protein
VRVFVSYRRGDASAWAGRLRDGLTARLDEDDVYQDVVTVDAGEDFALSINSALERCDVVLAVIGPQWLSMVGTDGDRRLDDPDDYVRIELGRALALNKRVIRCSSVARRCRQQTVCPTTSPNSVCGKHSRWTTRRGSVTSTTW